MRVDTAHTNTNRTENHIDVNTTYKPKRFLDSPCRDHEDSSPDILIRNKKSPLKKSKTMKNLKSPVNNFENSLDESSNNFKELIDSGAEKTETIKNNHKPKESRFKIESRLKRVEKDEWELEDPLSPMN